MSVKLAINGFGRIGRAITRALLEDGRTDLEIVAINDLQSVETNAHLLEFDSVHGRFAHPVTAGDGFIDVGRGPMRVTSIRNPAELEWGDIDIVLECTGVFKNRDKAQVYLESGARRVLVSAPSKGADNTVVYGVNHKTLTADHLIVSNASCTTNCLAPVAKVLNDTLGIRRGFMTTVHAYTGNQPTLDTAHPDLYRARAAGLSLIPTTTGAAAAVGLVLPELAGKLDGIAMRVPTPNVSAVDLKFDAARETSAEEVNAIITAAAASGPLHGILDVNTRALVSIDFNHNPFSSVLSTDQTRVLDGDMVRILSWYDNEWGFANRMLDTAAHMASLM